MSKGNVDKFLGLMQKDEGLARKMATCLYKLETNNGQTDGSGDFIAREIVPLAKEYGLEFTAQDFLDYTEEAKAKVGLTTEDLTEVSGGKGGVRAALMGTLALLGVATAPAAMEMVSGGEVSPFSMVASAADGDKQDEQATPERMKELQLGIDKLKSLNVIISNSKLAEKNMLSGRCKIFLNKGEQSLKSKLKKDVEQSIADITGFMDYLRSQGVTNTWSANATADKVDVSKGRADTVDVLKGRADNILSNVDAALQKGNVEEIKAEIQNVEDFLQYLNSLNIDDPELNQKKSELEKKKAEFDKKKRLEQKKTELKTALDNLQKTFNDAVREGYLKDKDEEQYDEGNDKGEYLAKQVKETLRLSTPKLTADDGDWTKINNTAESVNKLIEQLETFIEGKKLKKEQDEIKELVENIGNGEVEAEEVADEADKAKLAKQIDIRIKVYEGPIKREFDINEISDLDYEDVPGWFNLMKIGAALTNDNVNISKKIFELLNEYYKKESGDLDKHYLTDLESYAKQYEQNLDVAIENATKANQKQKKIDEATQLKQELAESPKKIKKKDFDSIVNMLIKVEEAIDSLNKKEEIEEKPVEKKDVKEEPKVEEKKKEVMEEKKEKKKPTQRGRTQSLSLDKSKTKKASAKRSSSAGRAAEDTLKAVSIEEQPQAVAQREPVNVVQEQKAVIVAHLENQEEVKPEEQVKVVAQGGVLGNANVVKKTEEEKLAEAKEDAKEPMAKLAQAIIDAAGLGDQALTDATNLKTQLDTATTVEAFNAAVAKINETIQALEKAVLQSLAAQMKAKMDNVATELGNVKRETKTELETTLEEALSQANTAYIALAATLEGDDAEKISAALKDARTQYDAFTSAIKTYLDGLKAEVEEALQTEANENRPYLIKVIEELKEDTSGYKAIDEQLREGKLNWIQYIRLGLANIKTVKASYDKLVELKALIDGQKEQLGEGNQIIKEAEEQERQLRNKLNSETHTAGLARGCVEQAEEEINKLKAPAAKENAKEPLKTLTETIASAAGSGGQALEDAIKLQKDLEEALKGTDAKAINDAAAKIEVAIKKLNAEVALNKAKENAEEPLETLKKAIADAADSGGSALNDAIKLQKDLDKALQGTDAKAINDAVDKIDGTIEALNKAKLAELPTKASMILQGLNDKLNVLENMVNVQNRTDVQKTINELRNRIKKFGKVTNKNAAEKAKELDYILERLRDLTNSVYDFEADLYEHKNNIKSIRNMLVSFKAEDQAAVEEIEKLEQELAAISEKPTSQEELNNNIDKLNAIWESIPQIKAMLNKATTLKNIAEQVDANFAEVFDDIIEEIEAADSVDKINLAEERLQNAEITLRVLMRKKINEAKGLYQFAIKLGVRKLEVATLKLIQDASGVDSLEEGSIDKFKQLSAGLNKIGQDIKNYLGEQIDKLIEDANKLKDQANGVDNKLYDDFNTTATNLAADKDELLKNLTQAAKIVSVVRESLAERKGDLMPKLALKKQIDDLKEQATKLKDMATGVSEDHIILFSTILIDLNKKLNVTQLEKIKQDLDACAKTFIEKLKLLEEIDALLENEVMGAEIQDELKAIKAGLPKADEANADTVVKAFDDVKAVKTKMANKLLEWHKILSDYHHKEGKAQNVKIGLLGLSGQAKAMLDDKQTDYDLSATNLATATALAKELAENFNIDNAAKDIKTEIDELLQNEIIDNDAKEKLNNIKNTLNGKVDATKLLTAIANIHDIKIDTAKELLEWHKILSEYHNKGYLKEGVDPTTIEGKLDYLKDNAQKMVADNGSGDKLYTGGLNELANVATEIAENLHTDIADVIDTIENYIGFGELDLTAGTQANTLVTFLRDEVGDVHALKFVDKKTRAKLAKNIKEIFDQIKIDQKTGKYCLSPSYNQYAVNHDDLKLICDAYDVIAEDFGTRDSYTPFEEEADKTSGWSFSGIWDRITDAKEQRQLINKTTHLINELKKVSRLDLLDVSPASREALKKDIIEISTQMKSRAHSWRFHKLYYYFPGIADSQTKNLQDGLARILEFYNYING